MWLNETLRTWLASSLSEEICGGHPYCIKGAHQFLTAFPLRSGHYCRVSLPVIVSLPLPPMVTGFHLLAVWQYIGECHFQGCQGYALHLAAVQASPTSQAPPPMLTSVDELNLKSFPLFYPCKPALNKWSVLFVHCITKAFLTLACPCFPVLEVDISTILHGRPLIRTWPFLRSAEHCWG